ncbi:EAL domain-containing protein [Thiocystis violacea]|uniref:EAL domain-containing protein n=1 Tax=Thiocystis violacea TaxID=13725 RepID=UPI001F5B63F3|nr:EAL domain-containing protein [Thiocystis violacea]
MKPTTNEASRGRVFCLGVDRELMAELDAVLEPRGVRLVAFAKALDLIREAAGSLPQVVLLDLAEFSGEGRLGGFIAALADVAGARPNLIGIASRERGEDTLEHRLGAMRAGVASYLVAPVAVGRLAARILRMCGLIEARPYRILLILADPVEGRKLATLLASLGMKALVVEDPMKVLARMLAFRPNLILADLYFPALSGAELAAIIRDHDDFFGIPLLFLSGETDLDRQLEALKAGGDGFVSKPVRRAALIAAVEYRMRMSRWLQDRRTLVNRRESAGGFLPRDVFMRHLERIIHADEVAGDGQGLLLIELDTSQSLLETLGLGATEALLRELEMRLGKLVGAEESATRLDDFRYALLARRESAEQLKGLADELRGQLAGLKPGNLEKELPVTVSVGVGTFNPPPDDVSALVSRGEKAVLSAKQAGGNRIQVWSPGGAGGGGTQEAESVIKRLVTTALAHDGLLLLFQPILSLNRQEDELYEAVIRLRTLDGEEIPPADFLSVAERSELMPRIDRWVLRRALEIMRARRVEHPRLKLLVHQNITTLTAPEWFPWLRDQIVQGNLTQVYPLLQVQMNDIRQHRGDAKPLIERLRNYGMQICVCHVTGLREEVSLLGRLGVTLVKLSLQTTREMEQTRLMDVIQSLQVRGISVIAPGIDDQAGVSRVWTCRPDFIQGHYLQMPSPDLTFDFQRMSHEN